MAERRQLIQPDSAVNSDWKPGSVDLALQGADNGDLNLLSQLVEWCFMDDRVQGALRHRQSIVRLPVEISAGNGGRAAAAAQVLAEGNFWDVFPSAEMKQLVKWLGLAGCALVNVGWGDDKGKPIIKDGTVIPRLKVWSLGNLFKGKEGEWRVRTGKTGREEVTLEEGNFFIVGAGDKPWRDGSWYSVATLCLAKRYALADWARASEKLGDGFILAEAPEVATKEQKKEVERKLRRMGKEKAAVFPFGWKVDLVEGKVGAHRIFLDQINSCNTAISIVLTGVNLTTEVQAGSYAATVEQSELAREIQDGDAEILQDWMRGAVLTQWAERNYGDVEAAPWVEYEFPKGPLVEKMAASWKVTGEAIEIWIRLGANVDVEKAASEVGLPLLVASARKSKGGAAKEPSASGGGLKFYAKRRRESRSERVMKGDKAVLALGADFGEVLVENQAPLRASVVQAVDQATSFADIRKGVLGAFKGHSHSEAAEALRASMVLAGLVGSAAVVAGMEEE